ncbi:MAG TPA: hypothetical protein VGR71_03405 [Nitrospira sp.]|nr:hypothetical protein [Nitrospira sp.]
MTYRDDAYSAGRDADLSAEIAANDNGPAKASAHVSVSVRRVPSHSAVNDNESANVRRQPLVAANDNDIVVTDDLPRPLPIVQGEGEVVRAVLGERFRQILMSEDL